MTSTHPDQQSTQPPERTEHDTTPSRRFAHTGAAAGASARKGVVPMRRLIGFLPAALLAVGMLAFGAEGNTAASGAETLTTEVLPNAEWELVGEVQAEGGPAVALGQTGALLTGYGEDGKRVYRYDPATGIRRVADSPAPLGAHFLARLADGRVLVGGGGGGFEPEIRARCFIYDPARTAGPRPHRCLGLRTGFT
jgi:hypothetical protein